MVKSINKNKLTKLSKGLLTHMLKIDPHVFSHHEIKHASKYFVYDFIEDRYLADDEILPYLHIPSLTKQQIVRIIGRNRNFLNYVDIKKIGLTVKDARHLLTMNPDFYEIFGFNENNQTKDDALSLLFTRHERLLDKINIAKHDFTGKESYAILEANNFKENIFNQINLSVLKDYHIADILIHTGTKYIDHFDLSLLSAKQWTRILIQNEDLIGHCDYAVFKKADIYYSVELVEAYEEPDFTFLIDERDYQEDLSGLGWTKLIIAYPDKYINDCNFNKLSESNWQMILDEHPNLIVYKP